MQVYLAGNIFFPHSTNPMKRLKSTTNAVLLTSIICIAKGVKLLFPIGYTAPLKNDLKIDQ